MARAEHATVRAEPDDDDEDAELERDVASSESPPRAEGATRLSLSTTLRADVIAGLTVALVGLPQCLAYAMMSGLPPAYGLATAAVPGLLAAIVGRSAQVITGPTNTTGLLILAALGPWLGESGLLEPAGLPALATLVLLAGVVRIVGAGFGGAQLLRFLPESVLVGFTAGAGILIGVMQLDEALGVRGVRGGNLIGELAGIADAVASQGVALPAIALTVVTGALIVAGKRFARWPIALVAVLAAMGGSWVLHLDASVGLPLVRDRSIVPSGWPPFAMPDLSYGTVSQFLLPAVAISVLGTLELTVAARGGGARPDMKRELFAQGVANLGGAFLGAFPASASLTRSALLRLGGAETRVAAAAAALIVVPILFLAGESVGYIPQASLAGVLLVTAYGMVDRARMRRMWKTSLVTRTLMVLTLGSTLLLPLEWAILIGTGAGLVIHVARTSEPRMRLLVPDGERLVAMPEGSAPKTVVVEVSGNLHYAAVPPFARRMRTTLPTSATLVIVDLSHAHELRFAAMVALEELGKELEGRGATLHLAGVTPRFARALDDAGSHLVVTLEDADPGASVHKALAAARVMRPKRED
ncbi:MAG: SulP family inorganic anion transporter [Sandaracinaceae bacterium]